MTTCSKHKILDEVAQARKYFLTTKYRSIVEAAVFLVDGGQYKQAKEMLKKLPTKEQLLNDIVEKLKNKSVYKTLKRINENKVKNTDETLKGLFSFGTHIAIETEKGNNEYAMLYPLVYERIGQLLYRR